MTTSAFVLLCVGSEARYEVEPLNTVHDKDEAEPPMAISENVQ
jgi:hypothetical protein